MYDNLTNIIGQQNQSEQTILNLYHETIGKIVLDAAKPHEIAKVEQTPTQPMYKVEYVPFS